MYLLRLSKVNKKYETSNGTRTVLNEVSLMLPENGFFSVVGKSGSGKSTLLNMISLMDTPTSGSIFYFNEDIGRWSKKRKEQYRNKDIGIVFQGYHLLENQSVLFNIKLPALIGGKSEKEADFAAKTLLKSINFNESLYHKKCKDLSGGEKERVAILRALINEPKIILADEPTGSLDSENSIKIMNMFKDISKTRLVLMVSHNENLVSHYSDTIIHIKDGKIDQIDEKHKTNDIKNEGVVQKSLRNKKWINHLSISNFKRRFKRNVISILSLTIGLVSTMLIVGFSNGNRNSIINRSYQQLDYGVATFYKETSQNINGSKMSLIKVTRPTLIELNANPLIANNFYIEPNCDSLLSPGALIKCGDSSLDDVILSPIYSFLNNQSQSLLLHGHFPEEDSFDEILINKSAYKQLKKKMNMDVINLELSIHYDYEFHYYTNEAKNPVIKDNFIFKKNITIVGVVDDFDFLSTPKIYYPHAALKEILIESPMVNLSQYLEYEITWYELLLQAGENDAVSSYSYRLFLIEKNKQADLETIINSVKAPYKLEANSIVITKTLLDLMTASTMGMEIFLFIAIMSTVLILGIISFSSYSEDKKTSAILTCLGANKSDIFSLYLNENILIGLISLLLSFIISPLLSWITNGIINKLANFKEMISIPIREYRGVPAFFPIILIVFTIFICVVSTYIPLFFSKKISPKEELSEE